MYTPSTPLNTPYTPYIHPKYTTAGATAFVRQFAARGMMSMQSIGDACFETVYAGAGGMGLYSYDGNYYGLPGRDIDGPRKFRK